MSAEIGNSYAEKFTREEILEMLQGALAKFQNGSYQFKYDALLQMGVSESLFSYWKTNRFKKDADVLESIKDFESFCKMSLFSGALKGDLNSTTAIFIGKSVHGMVEKGVELEINKDVPLVRVVSVKADGTRVER